MQTSHAPSGIRTHHLSTCPGLRITPDSRCLNPLGHLIASTSCSPKLVNCIFFFFFFLNHYALVSQANRCNMTFTAGNLLPSHSCVRWPKSSPHQDLKPRLKGGWLINWAIPPPCIYKAHYMHCYYKQYW